MIYALFYLGHHVVLTGAILAVLAAVGAFLLFRRRKVLPAFAVIGAAFVLFAANGFFGAGCANGLVNGSGQLAEARTVARFNSFTRVNKRDNGFSSAYNILITAPAGPPIRERFQDYQRILYPHPAGPVTSADYPSHVGDVFHVRYLPGHPDAFVILTNDPTGWAAAHNCFEAQAQMLRMKSRYDPDPTNPEYPGPYVAAIRAYLASGCTTDPSEIASLNQTLATLKATGAR